MNNIIKLIKNSTLLPLHWLSFLFIKDKKLWVFGSWFGERYSDNSKYIFEFVKENENEINAVWLTHRKEIVTMLRERGYQAYLINSVMGYIMSAKASVYFFTCGLVDVNRIGANRGIKYQLWHGVPLKKIGYDDVITRSTSMKTKISLFLFGYNNELKRWDYVNSSNSYVSLLFQSAFKKEDHQIIITGSPRNDVILKKERHDYIGLLNKEFIGCKFAGYFPTHRNEGVRNIEFLDSHSMRKLNKNLNELNIVLLVKVHFYHSEILTEVEGEFNRIKFLNDLEDINTILPHLDVLLTDYSSVFYDYLVLDKPIIFTPFDLEDYVTKDRELYDEYKDATPGPKCRNWEEVIEHLNKLFINNEDLYQKEREMLRKKIYKYVDTKNSKRVVEFIKSIK